jgi:hypothetical protein
MTAREKLAAAERATADHLADAFDTLRRNVQTGIYAYPVDLSSLPP